MDLYCIAGHSSTVSGEALTATCTLRHALHDLGVLTVLAPEVAWTLYAYHDVPIRPDWQLRVTDGRWRVHLRYELAHAMDEAQDARADRTPESAGQVREFKVG